MGPTATTFTQHSALSTQHSLPLLAWTSPITLQYASGVWGIVLGVLFLVGAAMVVLLGVQSLAGLGKVRKWVAIGIRLCVLLLLCLILGGVRWQRQHKDVEVIVLRDNSGSMQNVPPPVTGRTVDQALDDYLRAVAKDPTKKPDDRIGVVSFGAYPRVDAMPNKELRLDTRGTVDEKNAQGTDIAASIQLALATMSPDAMHRFLLVTDANQTTGDLDAALAAARAQNVPIDVAPVRYDVLNEVLIDRFVAPSWKRENEPFNLSVVLKSTNATAVTGKLNVVHQTSDGDQDMDMNRATAPVDKYRNITLKPGLNVEVIEVPALMSGGVHRFRAYFTPDKAGTTGVTASVGGQGATPGAPTTGPAGAAGTAVAGTGVKGDTIGENNIAEAFTFVRGIGQVLYIDNTEPSGTDTLGARLERAMNGDQQFPGDPSAQQPGKNPGWGLFLKRKRIDEFPTSLTELLGYDAVILANVPKGTGGLNDTQEEMLAAYVHDMGGGLVVIGGPDAFGAGGWEGSTLEKILPVDMAIPAQRQVGKGALVLVMHSCEMPNGNYYGEMCAQKAVDTLSSRDEIGVISYDWGGGGKKKAGAGIGGAQWDFPLAEKGDGSRVRSAIKNMQLGDMPSFDDALNLALNGAGGTTGLAASNARHKHCIIISDGDPQAPQQALMDAFKAKKITVSTVTVYPHNPGQSGRPPTMDDIANYLGGKAYGPIESNPNQLPQIFIKEATIVKRSLIKEDPNGIKVDAGGAAGDVMAQGIANVPFVHGMVLTSRKNDPKVEMPYSTGALHDPILAHWQTGLGKAAVWTSDATTKWAPGWVASADYGKLWSQIIRGVSRPPMSGDFDVRTTIEGNKGKIIVEALGKEGEYANFLNITGQVVGGSDLTKAQTVRLIQTGPGRYEAEFNATSEGSYVAALNYAGKKDNGMLLTGAVLNAAPERRDLKSNEARAAMIANRTGGRLLAAFDPVGAEIFTRDGLKPTASPTPVWDLLIPWLLGLIILDVAVRRIAWDWNATRRLAVAAAERVRAYTTLRKVEAKPTLEALRRVREEVAESKFRPAEQGKPAGAGRPPPVPTRGSAPAARPDPKAKFTAPAGVEGDLTSIVGGATDKPIPPPPKKIEPKGGSKAAGAGEHLGGLMAAKKRAQQQIKDKEEGNQ